MKAVRVVEERQPVNRPKERAITQAADFTSKREAVSLLALDTDSPQTAMTYTVYATMMISMTKITRSVNRANNERERKRERYLSLKLHNLQ